MQFSGFIEAVARRAGVPREQAATITRTVLQTMTERVSRGEIDDIAGELPDELKDYLVRPSYPPRVEHAERFGAEEFLRRVADRADVDAETARSGTEAVFATLREAVTVEEFRDMVGQLPWEYARMIEPSSGPPGWGRYPGRR